MQVKKDKLLSNACGCPPDGHKPVNGKCEPVCLGGKIWNAALRQCECPEGATLVEGKCQCPLGQIVVDKKCGCPADQTLTAEGKRACADKDKVPTIAEKCEPKDSKEGRSLTFEEMETAKKIFGDTIDYNKVKIITGKGMTFWGKILTLTGSAVTWGNTIYFPNNKDGSSQYDSKLNADWLMHEMTHIYQRQNDGLLYILKAIWEHLTKGDAAYEYQNALASDKVFKDFGVEQQAAIVQDYYLDLLGKKDPPLTSEQKEIMEKMLRDAGFLK
ncbi:MAG: DUF4157 domain-containing protein [Elusimicrobia bacterium]|nr:DUF4157 domain-containing protein [Elusimicrobiota bacterium]